MYKLKKYIFTILPLTISIFFLFCSNVFAYEQSYILSEDMFNALNNISSVKDAFDTYMSQNPSYTSYFIYYKDGNYYGYVRTRYDFYISQNGIQLDGRSLYCSYNNNSVSCSSSSDNYVIPYLNNSSHKYAILYCSISLGIGSINQSIGNTFNFSYDTYSYSFTSDGLTYFPTITDLNDLWFSVPPTPPDDYPLLTSFYSIFIEKLSLLCEYIYTNYIFLSIFVVLIIYFSILLLRRLK